MINIIKKITLALVFIVGVGGWVKADPFCTDWGTFNICLPIASGVDAAFGYDFRGHRSQGLGETPFGSWSITPGSKLVAKVGGVTSQDSTGAPFLGLDYELKGIQNPIPGIASINPGIYGGRDFHTNEDFWGVKFSIPIIVPH